MRDPVLDDAMQHVWESQFDLWRLAREIAETESVIQQAVACWVDSQKLLAGITRPEADQ